jgi:hypothetical protein
VEEIRVDMELLLRRDVNDRKDLIRRDTNDFDADDVGEVVGENDLRLDGSDESVIGEESIYDEV